MKNIKDTKLVSVYDGQEIEVFVREHDKNVCEFVGDDVCDESGLYYGTSDEREPMFCPKHFYQKVVGHNSGYELKKSE